MLKLVSLRLFFFSELFRSVFIVKACEMSRWWNKKTTQTVQPKYSDFHKIWENEQSYCRIIHFNDKEQSKRKSNHVMTSKYGIWSFIPLFFFEQLQISSNQYFIIISTLQQIPDASPLGKFTTIIPLSIIFCFSAIISIIKDIIKHRADYVVNHKYVEVLRNGILVREKWKEIGVGDIIRVNNRDIFPADIILLTSSELHGTCRLQTTDLNGKNSLKTKQCLLETMYCKNSKDFTNFNGIIECELPTKSVNCFVGRLTISNHNPIPLDDKQFLPRGSVLRRAKWIYGVVVYSGQETKMFQNHQSVFSKESKMDKIVHSQIIIMFIIIFALSILCSVCCTRWTKNNFKNHWYLKIKNAGVYTFCIQTISFFILFHNVIPVTLQVYIKLVRVVQAWFINNDVDMYHEDCNSTAMVRSSNLNVELGKVKHIFSNKTGTLTKNVMKLKHCSIGGVLYLKGTQNQLRNNMFNHSTKKYIVEFLRMMSVCHTVIPEKLKHTEEIVYNASSADERALVIGSQQFGFVFHDRSPKSITIRVFGTEEQYEVLNVIEFTNSRKKMSVIIRTPDSKIKLYCKGADVAIFKCLSKSGEKYKNQTMVHLNNFARAGYRTLCFAYVNVSENFYKTWNDEYLKASAVLIDRDAAKNKVAEKIERKLKLIGVTAIENELQDHVPQTIQSLMVAKIKIWLLTGDKQEAAINVGLSTKLITEDSPIIILNESKLANLGKTIHNNLGIMDLTAKKNNTTLIINGSSLFFALSNNIKMDFLKLCLNCKAIICCRISATQKSEIVELVTKYTNDVTLAVGDEIYDVPMFNKASIGVGILGLEGLQALSAADYSITQFKHLSKLLFVHGAWNYERISKMIYFFYYKNICFYALQLWFAMYSGWSSQILFDRWSICTYNVLFTATPPLLVGLFLNTRSAETRLKFPQFYSQNNDVFNYKMFTIWIVIAIFHSIFLFYICLFIMKNEVIWTNGKVGEFSVFGNIIYSCILVIVCLKAGLHVQSWSLIVHITTCVSILSWVLFIIIYNRLEKMLLAFFVSMNLNENMFKSSLFWFTLMFTASVVLILDIAAITIKRTLCNKGGGTIS